MWYTLNREALAKWEMSQVRATERERGREKKDAKKLKSESEREVTCSSAAQFASSSLVASLISCLHCLNCIPLASIHRSIKIHWWHSDTREMMRMLEEEKKKKKKERKRERKPLASPSAWERDGNIYHSSSSWAQKVACCERHLLILFVFSSLTLLSQLHSFFLYAPCLLAQSFFFLLFASFLCLFFVFFSSSTGLIAQ